MTRLLAALVLLLAAGCGEGSEVATFRVERRPFVHKVGAEGILAAEKTTPLTVPPDVETTLRLAWLAPSGSLVEAGQVVARFDRRLMEERLADGRTELVSTDLSVTETRAGGDARSAEIATERDVAQLELALAQRFQKDDEEVYSRHEILESRIDEALARERRRHADGAEDTEMRLSAAELALLEIRRRQAGQRISQTERTLERLEVEAPHAGYFLVQRDWRGETLAVGAEVWQGQPIGEIPDLETMEAEVYVLEADAGGLAVGKEAEVVVESRPDLVFRATVRKVDPVAGPRFRGSPVQYLGAVLAFETVDPSAMKPGGRVRATVYLERADAVLALPRQAVSRQGGRARVWVSEGGRLAEREVKVGASSRGLVVVESGLEPGEVVALRPPDAAAAAETTMPAGDGAVVPGAGG